MKTLKLLSLALALTGLTQTLPPPAQAEPLRLELTDGVIEPMTFAVPTFHTGLFREIPANAFISTVTSFASPVQYADWRAINAQALVTGAVAQGAGDRITVKFRVFDVVSGAPLGGGLQFGGSSGNWRRIAHKVADQVYSRITGESGYFDSRVVFVSESGPKNDRRKRLAIMDYDGANVQYLTDSASLVLAPRFSPTGDRVLYTSYESGFPRVYVLDVASVGRRVLEAQEGTMTFAPRFSPDGNTVAFSLSSGGNTDIYRMNVDGSGRQRLTSAPSIETAPSFSPDGRYIVFESDRSGAQQLYIMPATGGEARRISFGQGRYGTPVWSPRGDLIAFTKQNQGRFHIGVMRTDGSEERLLTASFLDEGPSWSPNGRVIMFTRASQGANGQPALYSVDISGRNLRRLATPQAASDPAWGPLQR